VSSLRFNDVDNVLTLATIAIPLFRCFSANYGVLQITSLLEIGDENLTSVRNIVCSCPANDVAFPF